MNRCKWFGHKWDVYSAYCYYVYSCVRCDYRNDAYCPTIWDKLKWKMIMVWDDVKIRVKNWFHCTECGHYFGRHDDTKDHLPF